MKEEEQAEFVKDPFNFMRGLLGEERSGRLHCPKEKVETYIFACSVL